MPRRPLTIPGARALASCVVALAVAAVQLPARATGTGPVGPTGAAAQVSWEAEASLPDPLGRDRFDLQFDVAPDGGCCSAVPMRWTLLAHVSDRKPCDHDDSVVEIADHAGDELVPSVFAVAPDLSWARGTIRGHAVSPCDGVEYPYFVEVDLEATGPPSGSLPGTVRRPGQVAVSGIRFCWDSGEFEDNCNGFGGAVGDTVELRQVADATLASRSPG